ncbi:methyltransferase domain-containing protein [Actinobacteria bacterium YIM 96077]|uniref:Methyltransferase type 11 n=1 Tax=Phytoactinopolyspora halophila TaxID=1981511 RepID=A0A329R155_9ACTN|nr:methyltransferase domain-containing protein [Phytoactinopolyspora halophila]AYY13276.1 methyltransferase domain-containing protein [Actinobacteria bacterium YIM 96077]RAW17679.1 methyltransferase type 11 [Phytoactinopolyspora halophila]
MVPETILQALRCPVCGAGLYARERALRCPSGHSFDAARHGYVNLQTGRRPSGTGDTADMVAARADFLGAGHYQPVARAVRQMVTTSDAIGPHASEFDTSDPDAPALDAPGLIVDAGAGTGYYLRELLDQLPQAWGVAFEVSRYALRRAARAHQRAGALGADVWRGLPISDGSASVVLDIFAPRHGAEFHRVLRPQGILVVVTPMPEHLRELVEALGLLTVDERKDERVEESLGAWFELDAREEIRFEMHLPSADVERAARMGPSAHHLDAAARAARVARLTTPMAVTGAVTVARYRPRQR